MQKNIFTLIIAIIILALIFVFVPKKDGSNTKTNGNEKEMKNPIITIETNKGNIVLELFQKDAPIAVEKFTTLTNKGFYNGLIFHRVIKNFMIQGGDPTGTGRGGPGYTFPDELDSNTESYQKGYVRGAVAMANAGPNTNGSQFFIMHQNYDLPHKYTIFGKVLSGLEVVDTIANTRTGELDRPIEDIVMNKVYLGEATTTATSTSAIVPE